MGFAKGHKKVGGRQRGTSNKATLQRAMAVEAKVHSEGRKLAIECMQEAMEYWLGLAAVHQPTGKTPNLKEFRECLKEATSIAKALAPYQTPTLQKTTLRQDAPTEPLTVHVKFV